MSQFFKKPLAICLFTILAALLAFVFARFMLQPNNKVHYHANFAVFINGQREQFKGAQYYQEVASCGLGNTPQSLVHMHDNISHVVHVHNAVQTWGQFFNNLGWVLGDTLISDGTNVYQDGHGGHLTFILNGHSTLSIADEVIKDKDRLLISFGNDDQAALNQQFLQVESDAGHFDVTKDPAACSGDENTWQNRLKRAVWF